MKFQTILLALIAALLGGCANLGSSRLPESAAYIKLVGLSSPKLIVRTPELRSKTSGLELGGVVVMAFGANTTEHTHLTISFYDQAEQILQSAEVDFAPRKLNSYRRSLIHRGHYKFPIASLPPGTIRIEVRAHE
jgi:hypothetical protein